MVSATDVTKAFRSVAGPQADTSACLIGAKIDGSGPSLAIVCSSVNFCNEYFRYRLVDVTCRICKGGCVCVFPCLCCFL